MFNNIGKKIKILAVVLCILGMIASLIGAIAIWSTGASVLDILDGYDSYNYYSRGQSIRSARDDVSVATILLGLGVLVFGCLLSWLGSFFAYGFGQLIEKTEENNYHLNQIGHMLHEMKNRR